MSAKTDKEEAIAVEVLHERDRQDAKWGEQNHPDGTAGPIRWLRYLAYVVPGGELRAATADEIAAAAKTATDTAAESGEVTWRDILLEEVAEAFAEVDSAKLRAELVQVSAVAQQWIGAIDRRAA